MPQPTPRALVTTQAGIESFTVSPAGALVIYARRVVAGESYRSHLWSVSRAGGRPRRLTSGAVRDAAPAISPDGSSVAFIRAPSGDPDAKPQVWLLPLTGRRRPWQLTRRRDGAAHPVWSPSGSLIAFLGEAGEDRFAVGLDPRRPKRLPTARHMTRLDYRDDESGLLGRRTHLWLVAPRRGARPWQLTQGDFDVRHPAFTPDGSAIGFAADLGPDETITPRSVILSARVDDRSVTEIASLPGDADRPAWSPDGAWLAFIGTAEADPPDHALARLWVQPADGGRPPRALTADLDRGVGVEAWADLVIADDDPGPAWLSGDELVVIMGDRGRNLPYRVSLGGEAAALVAPDRIVASAVAATGGVVTLCAGRDGRGAELFALEDGDLRQLTRNGSAWQDRFPAPRLDEVWVEGPGGPIQVWIESPPDAGDRALPTVLIAHGGPTGAHAPAGRMDALLLCGAGYRVVMPNIRGSASFGSSWIGALGGRWGEVDAADTLVVLDRLVADGLVDPDRLGIMGLSYGGYLTQWLVGVTDRFRAAVAENGVTNQISTWANSFFGVHYNRRAALGDPLTPQGVDQLWATSPLRNVARIRTPLLMLQSEEDRVCPLPDNEQLFTALKVLGREVEWVQYPEEHHEMKDLGRPDRRIDRMERVLAWFERWMPAG